MWGSSTLVEGNGDLDDAGGLEIWADEQANGASIGCVDDGF